jgi:hypothetical protein
MKKFTRTSWLLAVWAAAVILIGAALMSYHQPFRTPSNAVLALVKQPDGQRWRALHVLSGSCGCSQKVMLHLLQRGPIAGISEQILVVDGEEDYLPGSHMLLARLDHEGFAVTHVAAKDIPQTAGLYGVPLLVLASPGNKIAYMGGYGARGDQDGNILQQIRFGKTPEVLAVRGCAVGERLRRKADPFHLKY